MSAWIVLLLALATALATGLGALPLLVPRLDGPAWTGRGDALAAGFMVGAAVALTREGIGSSVAATLGGAILGAVVLLAVGRLGEPAPGAGPRSDRTTRIGATAMFVGVMTLHSAAEGIGVGVAFGGGDRIGVMTTIAIAIHNVPEGLAIALVAVPRGASIARAAVLGVVSSIPQPIVAVPAFLLVEHVGILLPWGFGLAAGAMVAMAAGWLAPDAVQRIGRSRTIAFTALGLVAMLALQALMG